MKKKVKKLLIHPALFILFIYSVTVTPKLSNPTYSFNQSVLFATNGIDDTIIGPTYPPLPGSPPYPYPYPIPDTLLFSK